MLEISLAKLTLADRWMDSGGCKKLVCDCFLCLSLQTRRADSEWTKHFAPVQLVNIHYKPAYNPFNSYI